jgi:biopolymer transport protein ExbD
MRRFSDRHSLHTVSELNVTPLLDLAFVLLIIFMITTPLMENKVELALPTSDATKTPVEAAGVLNIAIAPDASVSLNGTPLTLVQLETELASRRANDPDTAVIVRSDKAIAVQKLIDVMDAIQRAQIKRVGVVTTPAAP